MENLKLKNKLALLMIQPERLAKRGCPPKELIVPMFPIIEDDLILLSFENFEEVITINKLKIDLPLPG